MFVRYTHKNQKNNQGIFNYPYLRCIFEYIPSFIHHTHTHMCIHIPIYVSFIYPTVRLEETVYVLKSRPYDSYVRRDLKSPQNPLLKLQDNSYRTFVLFKSRLLNLCGVYCGPVKNTFMTIVLRS